MNSELTAMWFLFLRDINVNPPQFQNSMSIEAWCPKDTKDTIRLQQKRPLLRQLLASLENGTYDERDYPQSWQERETFERLTAGHSLSSSLVNWILEHMNGYDEDFVANLQPTLRVELELQFDQISTHELELFQSSISLFEKIHLLCQELELRKERNIANKTSKTYERTRLLTLYDSQIIEPQKDIFFQIEGTRSALYDYMMNLILDVDSNSLVGFKELSRLPTLDSILEILGTLPDLSNPEILESLDYQIIGESLRNEMESYVEKLSESLKIEPNSIELKSTMGQGPEKSFMTNQININVGGKQTNVMQNTSIQSEFKDD